MTPSTGRPPAADLSVKGQVPARTVCYASRWNHHATRAHQLGPRPQASVGGAASAGRIRGVEDDAPALRLEAWTGPWRPDDPDANFKHEVALLSAVDPLRTIEGLSRSTGIPAGALARYVLARWASEGSAGLLELGPTMVGRLWSTVEQAEAVGTAEARLAAYDELRQLLSWLRVPLDDQEVAPPEP